MKTLRADLRTLSVVYRRPHPSRPRLRQLLLWFLTVGAAASLSYLILQIRW